MAAIIPTKSNLIALKRSLSLAKLGYELMDRKRNILVREMMALIDKAKQLQDSIDETFSNAYANLQLANITLGESGQLALAVPADNGLELHFRSVMGVELPIVTYKEHEKKIIHYGFSETNSLLDIAVNSFEKAKLLCCELAEVENSVYLLAMAIKKAQKRANSLTNIIIPNLQKNVGDMSNALEEKDREEFARLKVIKKYTQKKNNE